LAGLSSPTTTNGGSTTTVKPCPSSRCASAWRCASRRWRCGSTRSAEASAGKKSAAARMARASRTAGRTWRDGVAQVMPLQDAAGRHQLWRPPPPYAGV